MADRPNLLLFMPETVRADAMIGPPGHRARTPNLDRLAETSVCFTQAFAQMAYCSPSRISMFSGRYPHTEGRRSLIHLLQAGERNLFLDLKEAGYYNAAFGKNDLLSQEAARQCFDECQPRVAAVHPGSMPNPWPEDHRFRHSFYRGCRPNSPTLDGDWARIESALRFIDNPPGRPWCLFLPLSFAHPPYEVEEPFFSMHDRDEVPAPIRIDASTRRHYLQTRQGIQGCDRLDQHDFREIKATYFGMVSRLDWQLGLLMERLEQRRLLGNTIVVVFSDHGDYAGDYGMVEKCLVGFEDCLLHVPLVIRAPGVPGGRSCPQLVEMTDLYPTLLDLLGLQAKHDHFGRSLTGLISGRTDTHRQAIFAEGGMNLEEVPRFLPPIPPTSDYFHGLAERFSHPRTYRRSVMVRTDRHKYVYCPEDRDELYDLIEDPIETRNIADEPASRQTVAQLRERLLHWFLYTGDVMPAKADPRGWPK